MKRPRILFAAACAAVVASCGGVDPFYSVTPADGQGAAATPFPSGAQLIVRPGLPSAPTEFSANIATNAPVEPPLVILALENRDGSYFLQSIRGSYAGEVRPLLENGLRAIRAPANPDAFLIQFNNIGDRGRAAFAELAVQGAAQAVAILPGLRRCTAATCAMWLFSKDLLASAAQDDPDLRTSPGGAVVAMSSAAVGRAWRRALENNTLTESASTNVILYRHTSAGP